MAIKGNKKIKTEQSDVKAVMEAVKDVDLDKVINEVGSLQIKVQNTLASLSGELANRVKFLENVNTAINIKENRLKELHDIEDMAITIDDMKAVKEQEYKLAEEERFNNEKQLAEEEAEYCKNMERNHENWTYSTEQEKKKWQDQFESEVATSKRNEAIRQEMLNKTWNERESTIKAKEQEYQELVKQVQGFDVKVKNEVAKAETIVKNTIQNTYEHQMALLKKDSDAEKNNNMIKNSAYELSIKNLEEQIKDLKVQLISARNDAKEVATQALQSASGRQVADALQRVVDSKDNTIKSK